MDKSISQNTGHEVKLNKDEQLGNTLALRSRGLNPESRQYSLDFFGDPGDKRIQPNDIARSALWIVSSTVEREYLKNVPIFSTNPAVNVFYTGEQLQAGTDEKVWRQLVYHAHSVKFGDVVNIRISDICQAIGWARNGHYYKTVWASLERLHNAGLKVKKGKTRVVAFIRMLNLHTAKGDNTESDGVVQYSLDNTLNGWLLLLAGGTVTFLENEPLKRLKPIATRLYTWLASHKEHLPLSIYDFHSLCGSAAKIDTANGKAKWRTEVRKAIDQLLTEGLIKQAWVENEHIFIIRK